jgi:homoserine O-succinyltransferase/O-acetyltransferase
MSDVREGLGSGLGEPPRVTTAMPQPARDRRGEAGGKGLDGSLTVGIVNNMPDGALKATERQFLSLLQSSRGTADLRIRLFYLPEIARGEDARAHLDRYYAPFDDLLGAELDALVVTGSEPRRSTLEEEVYWPSLSRLVEWARHNTLSTFWSCLAAHAAVLHLDGVRRLRQPAKVSGLYDVSCVSEHPLLRGAPLAFRLPHSRHNGLSRAELDQHGYQVLTCSEEVGVDLFVKACPSLFVFAQGHPEYEGDSLQREYQRDMTRYLAGQTETCPSPPKGCFDDAMERTLAGIAQQPAASRPIDVLEHFAPLGRSRSVPDWHVALRACSRTGSAMSPTRRRRRR